MAAEPARSPDRRKDGPERTRLRAEALPAAVLRLASTLREAGGQAWLVGGAVRDLLLGRPVHDWDLATDLPPDAITPLFPHTLQIGARFGTVTVVQGRSSFEVTTFRSDGRYSDARRPDEVSFTRSLEEDLIRRDFTVNALAYDPLTDRLADPAGGSADLARRLIRAVGRAEERFQEDGLRLLRAVRFGAQLRFDLEERTYRGLVLCAPRLERISMERIREEFDRLLEAPRPAYAVDLLYETGLLRRFLPELAAAYGIPQNPHHAYSVFYHTLAALDACRSRRRVVLLAVLFHDLAKPETRTQKEATATFYGHQNVGARLADRALRRLRYPNEEREDVAHLVRHHMFHYRPEWTDGAIRRFLRDVRPEHLDALFAVRAADTMGNGLRTRLAPELQELRHRIDLEIERQSALTVRDLAVDGHDLMDLLGIGPGPAIGRVLAALLEEVLDQPSLNEREHLLARAKEIYGD